MTTGARCEHQGCTLPPQAGKAWCILHDPDPDKDKAEFQRVLEQKLKDGEADPEVADIDLSGVHFPALVNWSRREFPKAVSFWYAQFHQEASFVSAQFHGRTDFRSTRFSATAPADFSRSTVAGHLHFVGAEFPKAGDTGRVLFRDVAIERDGEVLFEGVDLSRASFLRTDLSHFRFRGVTWPARRERIWGIPRWTTQRRVLFDHLEMERLAKDKGQRPEDFPTPHLVGELYRQLRLNLEPARQEIEAGDFYIGQMDMRRQDKGEFSPGYRALLGFYRFAAIYGESWQRPLGLYFLLGFAFAFVYLLAGFEGIGSPVHYRLALGLPALGDYAQALAHALTAGGILQQDLRLLSWWAPLARYANALADIFLLAVAVVALRRRFRR